jgi:hypothetical protein
VLALEQDFYGMFFVATLESVLSQPEQAALKQASQAHAHVHSERSPGVWRCRIGLPKRQVGLALSKW